MNKQIKYPLLASPASIGSLELKNRMIMAAMGSNFASEDGHITDQLVAVSYTHLTLPTKA